MVDLFSSENVYGGIMAASWCGLVILQYGNSTMLAHVLPKSRAAERAEYDSRNRSGFHSKALSPARIINGEALLKGCLAPRDANRTISLAPNATLSAISFVLLACCRSSLHAGESAPTGSPFCRHPSAFARVRGAERLLRSEVQPCKGRWDFCFANGSCMTRI